MNPMAEQWDCWSGTEYCQGPSRYKSQERTHLCYSFERKKATKRGQKKREEKGKKERKGRKEKEKENEGQEEQKEVQGRKNEEEKPTTYNM